MPSPFPGMDPYLEQSEFWRDVHHWLISATVEQLQPQVVALGYVASVESLVWLEKSERNVSPDVSVTPDPGGIPPGPVAQATLIADEPVRLLLLDEEINEDFVQIHEIGTRRLVCGIEVISPSNRKVPEAREQYLRKRREILREGASLVEIDLLRDGKPLVRVPRSAIAAKGRDDYLVNIARARRREYEFYSVAFRERLPRINVPLGPDDPDAVLDLQAALGRAYEVGCYARKVDYSRPPRPPLSPANAGWAKQLLIASGRRPTGQ